MPQLMKSNQQSTDSSNILAQLLQRNATPEQINAMQQQTNMNVERMKSSSSKQSSSGATPNKLDTGSNQQYTPVQIAALAAIMQVIPKQVNEAVQQGVPYDSVLKDVGLDKYGNNIAQQQNQDQFAQGAENLVRQPKNIFQAFASGFSQDYRTGELENLAKAQLIAGKQPLQEGDRQKLYIEAASNEAIKQMEINAKNIEKYLENTKALSPEASAKFTILLDGQKATKQVASLLSDDSGIPFSRWSPNILKTDSGKKFKSAMLRMLDAKSRSESGATITDKEFDKEFKKFGINIGDSKEVVRSKLAPLYEWYSSALNIADPTGVHRERAVGNKQPNIIDLIAEEKKRRGM